MRSTSCRYCYGLFVRRCTGAGEAGLPVGTLVAVAGFSGARRWNKDGVVVSSYEWVRYASLAGYRVVGGMGKLLGHFVSEVHPDDVMSYSDPGSADGGGVYRKLGFESEGTVSKPGFVCEKFRKRYQAI